MLLDDQSGPVHWASAIICGQAAWERALLNHQNEPLIIKINRAGTIQKIAGNDDLIARRDQLLTLKIVRAKRSGQSRPGMLQRQA